MAIIFSIIFIIKMENQSSIKEKIEESSSINQMVKDQISQSQKYSNPYVQKEKILNIQKNILENSLSKKSTTTWLFVLHLNGFFMLGVNIWFLILVKIQMEQYKAMLVAGQAIFSSVICGLVNYKLAPNWKQVIKIFFVMDNIFINMIITSIAFSYQVLISDYKNTWDLKLYIPFYCMQVFFLLSSLKISLVYAKWCKLRVLLFKGTMFFLSLTFLYFGVYYINTRQTFIKIDDSVRKLKMNGFQILYVFSAFTHFFQLYKKFSYFDGTNHFRHDYTMKDIGKKNIEKRKNMIIQRRNTMNTLLSFSLFKKAFIGDTKHEQNETKIQEKQIVCQKDGYTIFKTKSPFRYSQNFVIRKRSKEITVF